MLKAEVMKKKLECGCKPRLKDGAGVEWLLIGFGLKGGINEKE
jgi:hypothetical protein